MEEIRDLPWRDVLLSAGRKEEDELAGHCGPRSGRSREAPKEVEKEKKKKKKEKVKKKRARSSSSSSRSSSTSSEVKRKAVEQKVMFGGVASIP